MNNFFLRGIRFGVRTQPLPSGDDIPAAVSQGLPATTTFPNDAEAESVASCCPTDALSARGNVVTVVEDRCVACMRCKHAQPSSQHWRRDVAWAHTPNDASARPLGGRFARSIHVRVVDAGDCGACLNEIAQLNGPTYNLHRFGIFITPTPRLADVLLVVGPVTRQMHDALRAAYEAMPEPKRVVAVGACAASGGIFGPSVMCAAGAGDAVVVDLVVPGCPPPPAAIAHALRSICGA
jgi:Ni,Fe-hydrogenase III small subunit